ncbi:MAG: DNA-processing protein DprA [Oscillospiraceae bacterium]
MLAHWIWLATRSGIGVRSALALLRAFPDIESLYGARAEDYVQAEGVDSKCLDALCDKSLSEANRILGSCLEKGIHVLTYQDAAYPTRLKHIPDPPLTLYYQGNLPDFDAEPAVAVVGTRRASAYGCMTARRMGYQIARCGGLVVSGAAGGVDTLAMKGALLAERPVVGVLGNGLDVIYPRSNRDLYRDVACRGCLISEFPPGTPPLGRNFPRRNRIISGLCCGVVVVEAPEKSGALITAQLALDQGRDVFAVPGNVDAACSAGSNGLLREGAIVAQSGWDVMEEYQSLFPEKVGPWSGKTLLSSYPRELAELREPPYHFAQETPINSEKNVDNEDGKPYSELQELMSTLSDDERAVTSCLTDALRHVDDVIAGSGLPAARVLASLTLLEVKGLVVWHPGKFYSLARRGAGEW